MLDETEWFKVEGARPDALSELVKAAPFPLPEAYLALLRYSNGGEGSLPIDPWNFCLDPAEVATASERDGTFKEFFPNKFVIGTSGGGEAIAFELSASEPHPIVQFDMTNSDLSESVRPLALSFDAFLNLIGHS